MKLKTRALGVLAALCLPAAVIGTAGAADRAYTEGPVVIVTSLRTQPGKFDEYLKYLAGPYKQVLEEQKKTGIILDYGVYSARPRSPDDPDIYLTVTYKNMAALDDLTSRTDPISERLLGSLDQQSAATVERGKLRTAVGSEVLRELIFK
jgi:hypothetical protein